MKGRVEWTSEGDQNDTGVPCILVLLDDSGDSGDSDDSGDLDDSGVQYVRRRWRSVIKGRRMMVRAERVLLYQAGWHRRILSISCPSIACRYSGVMQGQDFFNGI